MKKVNRKWQYRLAAVLLAGMTFFGATLTASAATPLTSDNFDSKRYADQYADVKAEHGYDHDKLWNHYVKYGVKENRIAYATNGDVGMPDPNAALTKDNFDAARYAEDYADLKSAFGEDRDKLWNHYQNFGVKEGRKAYVIGAPRTPAPAAGGQQSQSQGAGAYAASTVEAAAKFVTYDNFHYKKYADLYPDLKAAFGYNKDLLWKHYQNNGKREGRLIHRTPVATGIDVSSWQYDINWGAVKNSGVSYAIIRLGYRGSVSAAYTQDEKYHQNMKNATAAGVKVGIYFVTQALNEAEAIEEAQWCLNAVKGYNVSLPIFLDVETSNGRGDKIDKATRTAVCKAFCQTITNGGYKAGIYANKNWMTNHIDMSQLTPYTIWLAQYWTAPTWDGTHYEIWQYSSSGSVPGINTRVDMNEFYVGF